MTSATHQGMTIDALAARVGMTVRNVRAHQSRGLLPPPDVRGRTGFYGGEHIARIELIKELQADGFNLEAIRRLVDNAGGSSAEVLRFTREVRDAFDEEEPEIVTLEELVERWGQHADQTPARPNRMNQCAGLASGPGSRPLSMWMLMSQYMPNRATSSDSRRACAGSAAQTGTRVAVATRWARAVKPRSLPARWRRT